MRCAHEDTAVRVSSLMGCTAPGRCRCGPGRRWRAWLNRALGAGRIPGMSEPDPPENAPDPAAPAARFDRRRIYAVIAGVLAVVAVIAIVAAVHGQQTPPKPGAAADPPPSSSTAASSSAPAQSTPAGPSSRRTGASTSLPTVSTSLPPLGDRPRGPLLPAANPTSISIPALKVQSSLLRLGRNIDGSLKVPPLERDSKASWFNGSPQPGTLGPSIILGHIDSAAYGPAIFFRLGALKPGDQVMVARADHTVAVFRIDRVVEYPKAQFPLHTVFGNINYAGLRLITCGGKFDPSVRSYEDNIVAFATLVSSHPG